MRSETEVLDQIKAWAEAWDDIRAVILTGSRANPVQSVDALSDYDLDVYVRETASIVRDESWLDQFGSIMVRWPLQPQSTFDRRWITQLALFDDEVRIDFQFTATPEPEFSHVANHFRVLVDKDGIFTNLADPASTRDAYTPPSAEEFEDRLNAFWWDIPYVAKALRRGEINYAKYVLDGSIRFAQLLPLLNWHVEVRHGGPVDAGMYGRWIHRHIDEPTWEHYLRTFSGADADDTRRAMFGSIALVRSVGAHIASSLAYQYPHSVDTRVTGYIKRIHQMDSEELRPSRRE